MRYIKEGFRNLIKSPLGILRFFLSFLIGRSLLGQLTLIKGFSNNLPYALSKTWITDFFPEPYLVFDQNYLLKLKYVIVLTTIGSMLGVLGRLNLLILSVMSFFLIGVAEGLGAFNHHLSLSSQVLFILVFVPGSIELSVDYALLKWYRKEKNNAKKAYEPKNWGIGLIMALLMLTYFTAGISKIRYGGFKWFDGSTLGFYLQERTFEYPEGEKQLIIGNDELKINEKWKDKYGFHGHTYGNYQISPLAHKISDWVSTKKSALIFLSVITVLFELMGFVMFINGRFRNFYLFSAILLHTSIGFLMGLTFTHYRVICLCVIDWSFLRRRLGIGIK